MQRVLVPLEQRKQKPDTIGAKHYVRETYVKKLQKYDLLPVFVSTLMSSEAVSAKLAAADGLLLMGGLDIDSSQYADGPAHKKSESSPVRDGLEIPLVRKAFKEKLPVLGICRGCQVMAVAAGGSLYQHLPEAVPGETHGESVDGEGYNHVVNINHTIYIKEDTLLDQLVDSREITVTSGHHQAVKDPGEHMRIAAESSAGVVEAIEHTDEDYFCLGLQSHPEAEEEGALESAFSAFASAMK